MTEFESRYQQGPFKELSLTYPRSLCVCLWITSELNSGGLVARTFAESG